jgi:hypothetical protein
MNAVAPLAERFMLTPFVGTNTERASEMVKHNRQIWYKTRYLDEVR